NVSAEQNVARAAAGTDEIAPGHLVRGRCAGIEDRRDRVVVAAAEVVDCVDRPPIGERGGIEVEGRAGADGDGYPEQVTRAIEALNAVDPGRYVFPCHGKAAIGQRGHVVRQLRAGLIELIDQDIASNHVATRVIDAGANSLTGAVDVTGR